MQKYFLSLNSTTYKIDTLLDMNQHTIQHLPLPIISPLAVNKQYVDDNFFKNGRNVAMTGNLNMNNNVITGLLTTATLTGDSATPKDYVLAQINNLANVFLPYSGIRPLTGNLNMNNNAIKNVKDPVNATDVADKKYVDDSPGANKGYVDNNFLKLSGGTMTGDIYVPAPVTEYSRLVLNYGSIIHFFVDKRSPCANTRFNVVNHKIINFW